MIVGIHPFPARMAPDLALDTLSELSAESLILDPMTGSGTVAQQAKQLGLRALGFDLDPLAVLISKVSTQRLDNSIVDTQSRRFIAEAKRTSPEDIRLPWLDGDEDGEAFVRYWFAEPQRHDLRRIAGLLACPERIGLAPEVADLLRIALSRIIITKKQTASLAQDTSHSRPHRVATNNIYDVFDGFERSVKILQKRISNIPESGEVTIGHGDARNLSNMENESVDAVLTSPPYLNAIDYMRGHRMSLIWLGFALRDLRTTRSNSIGAERRPDPMNGKGACDSIQEAMGDLSGLGNRQKGMVQRYAADLHSMVSEVSRVLKSRRIATFVIGNSCLKGVFIQNSEGLLKAAELAGLKKIDRWERDLPDNSRYLPTPSSGSLSKRMRKEVILRVAKP